MTACNTPVQPEIHDRSRPNGLLKSYHEKPRIGGKANALACLHSQVIGRQPHVVVDYTLDSLAQIWLHSHRTSLTTFPMLVFQAGRTGMERRIESL